jgi:hypothetical protein
VRDAFEITAVNEGGLKIVGRIVGKRCRKDAAGRAILTQGGPENLLRRPFVERPLSGIHGIEKEQGAEKRCRDNRGSADHCKQSPGNRVSGGRNFQIFS